MFFAARGPIRAISDLQKALIKLSIKREGDWVLIPFHLEDPWP